MNIKKYGVVILDKNIGDSSQQAVKRIKKILQVKKAGHTGTLDVLASGMLPICLGEATKFADLFTNKDKKYQVTAKFGEKTDTFDTEGKIIATADNSQLQKNFIIQQLVNFRGKIQQQVPAYSAIKVAGETLYKLARKNIIFTPPIREQFGYNFDLISSQHPYATFAVHCNKGTYIRSLINDLGELLQCYAHVTALRRTAIDDDWQMHNLSEIKDLAWQTVLPLETILKNYPSIIINPQIKQRLYWGQGVLKSEVNIANNKTKLFVLKDQQQQIFGISKFVDEKLKIQRLIRQDL